MDEPLAYFLTWTCHGTWLHGDARGSVAPGYNVPGTGTLPPNVTRVQIERALMTTPPFELTPAARDIVRRAIEEHASVSGWTIHALNVRTNHVHMVVGNAGIPPERMMNSCKSWATRRLREAGVVAANERIWTRHGSTQYLWNEAGMAAAAAYVQEGQDVPR